MLKQILATMRWSFSIGNKFFRVVPGATLAIVLATLVSQLSVLLAFLLPLKILMLLGSTGIPRYFPAAFSSVNREFLVLTLSLSAVGFYILFIMAEKVISFLSKRGADLLLERSKKIALFENQEEIASRGYQRYARSLAGSVFLFLVAFVMAWLYPELLMALAVYISAAFVFFAIAFSKQGKLAAALNEAPGHVVSTATSIGFLLIFGFMVSHFLLGDPPGLLIAIISLILMRQGFSRITGLVSDLKGLYSQRFKLNALFFHGHVLVNESKKHETNFWSFLKPPQRDEWMIQLIRKIAPRPIANLNIRWWQLGGQDVATFRVMGFDDEGLKNAEYLVKLFNTNRSSLAKHEATLLLGSTVLPAFPLIDIDQVGGFHCHIFEWLPANKISQKRLKAARRQMLRDLLVVEPDEKLVSQFKRSRPPIWQRIDSRMLDRLCTVAEILDSEYVSYVEGLRNKQPVINKRLSDLPLNIVNPESGPDAFHRTDQGEILVAHWGRWTLEPVGAGWPTQPEDLVRLSNSLKEAIEKRQALCDVHVEDVSIAALMYALEKLYIRQDFIGALRLIPRILQCLEATPEASKASA
ncbi:hypothetical protein OCT51_12110 [Halomonas sp. LR3S48]|uniref:hypothetical protein n=1 Tax=Halomonas sp. LR3S48 TaxID=2982694 RepID=UPI0021E3D3AE|nr:hypothetical protein [Halomonas sp. LR3S48]UYG01949.1 hypothetical protein OCT51_12110 [Halomonas sp. LR3S48]